MKDKEKQIEKMTEIYDRKTALRVLQDLSKRMYPSLDLFGHPTLVIDRPNFEEVRKKYLDELPKDSVVLSVNDWINFNKKHANELIKTKEEEYGLGYNQGSKETAEKIYYFVGDYYDSEYLMLNLETFIKEQFSVEIKE